MLQECRQTTHKRKKRLATLNARVPTRVCPMCNRTQLKNRSWIILSIEQYVMCPEIPAHVRAVGAMCRSCYLSLIL